METIKIHSIEKHRELQELGQECIRKEKMRNKKKLHLFIYQKNDVVVSVLNSKPSKVVGGVVNANSKY